MRRDERRERFAAQARAGRPDLARLCLLIGAEADEELDEAALDAAEVELDRLAGQVPYRPGGPAEWARALRELLGVREGFHGLPKDYERLGSSLLPVVLRRRRGLPILLSVVWIEVARRAGAPVYGLALPGHFVVGFGAPGAEQVLVDPFDGGRPLSGQEAGDLVERTTGGPLEPERLRPAEPLEIVRRVLNNISAWAAARPERGEVALWAVELSLLLPSHPAELRYERARLLVRLGDFLTGAAELEAYAEIVEPVSPDTAARLREQARGARARLN
ncbi:transglutaminase-like domain-containing protein [Streptomyces sp. NPDC049954]|uniref:SirB1 family protein n=1 Tax=Streptomyces sp. NPDC049954 TaxID=3155779 RepID=UPI00343DC452